jgi:hypothetical protein
LEFTDKDDGRSGCAELLTSVPKDVVSVCDSITTIEQMTLRMKRPSVPEPEELALCNRIRAVGNFPPLTELPVKVDASPADKIILEAKSVTDLSIKHLPPGENVADFVTEYNAWLETRARHQPTPGNLMGDTITRHGLYEFPPHDDEVAEYVGWLSIHTHYQKIEGQLIGGRSELYGVANWDLITRHPFTNVRPLGWGIVARFQSFFNL